MKTSEFITIVENIVKDRNVSQREAYNIAEEWHIMEYGKRAMGSYATFKSQKSMNKSAKRSNSAPHSRDMFESEFNWIF